MWLGPDTMRPILVGDSFNTMLPSSQPFFYGFGNNYEARSEPLLPMEFPMGDRQGFRAQAPIFQSPGYEPMQNLGPMSGLPIPEAHLMGNDSGGNDGSVLKDAVAPAMRRGPSTATTMATAPRQMQLPSQVLQTRQAEAVAEPDAYDASLLSVWHPQDFLPEDYPDLDPAYSVTDAANPPRITSKVPLEAWIPGEIFRVPTGTSIVEPHSVPGDNGRLYNGYREGKYLLPNDPVTTHVSHMAGKH